MAETSNVGHASIAIEISNLTQLLTSSFQEQSPSISKCCIFKVPGTLRQRNGNVFDPNIVSIGPFHHGNERLAPMEKIKLWYLHCLLRRFDRPREEILEHFIESIAELPKQPGECYARPTNDLDDPKFILMMVVDGCFLIELFRKNAGSVRAQEGDPIFNTSWMFQDLYQDLLLLENQIPWFILQHLFGLTVSVGEPEREPERDLAELVLKFFETMMLMTVPAEYRPGEGHEIRHILDLIRSCLLPSSSGINLQVSSSGINPQVSSSGINPQVSSMVKLRPMADLLGDGIKFKSGDPYDILNIKLNKGVVEIPPIKIQRNSESLLRNLIAYEQCDGHCSHQLTSYAVFLDCLINTKTDAAVMIGKGIVVPELKTDDMYLLFNRLFNDTIPNNFHYSYSELTDGMNKYFDMKTRRMTQLRRDYFNDPWVAISFVNGIVALFLAASQVFIALYNPVGK